jgi:hypothetical protein
VTEPASGIASDAATLDGTVTPNGETISDCHFDYGTDTSYGSSAPCGSTSGAVSATLTGLAASTGYHYRLVITPAGASPITGADQQFTTAAAPNPVPGTGSGDPGTGTPGPGPGPQPGPPEVTPAQLAKAASVSGTKRATRGGTVKLGRLTCPAICGTVKVLAKHGTTVVGRGSGKLTTGHSLAADFQLNAAARRLLKRVGRLSVKVTVTVTDATGAVVTVTRSMVLKPAP